MTLVSSFPEKRLVEEQEKKNRAAIKSNKLKRREN